jgi:hypothetical protein
MQLWQRRLPRLVRQEALQETLQETPVLPLPQPCLAFRFTG